MQVNNEFFCNLKLIIAFTFFFFFKEETKINMFLRDNTKITKIIKSKRIGQARSGTQK